MGKITPVLLLIYLLFPALTHSGETMESICKKSIVSGRLSFIKNSYGKHMLYIVVDIISLVYNNSSTYLTMHFVYIGYCIKFIFWLKYYICILQMNTLQLLKIHSKLITLLLNY